MHGAAWKANLTNVSWGDLLCQTDEPLAECKLRVLRLKYMCRVVRFALPGLFAYLQANVHNGVSFNALLTDDLCWLHEHNCRAAEACADTEPIVFLATVFCHES